MILSKKQNPHSLVIGDIVEIDFDFNNEEPFEAAVTDIIDRSHFGYDPCIEYSRLDGETSEPEMSDSCSISFVKQVTERYPRHWLKKLPERNVFREQVEELCEEGVSLGFEKVRRNVYRGHNFGKMVVGALATVRSNLTMPLKDNDVLERMWIQAGQPGRLYNKTYNDGHFWGGHTYVNWKVFKVWVNRNKNRLLCSRRDVEEMGEEYTRGMNAILNEDFMSELGDSQTIGELLQTQP